MSDTMVGVDRTEEGLLACDISDEALETAAGSGSEKTGELHVLFLYSFRSLPWSVKPEDRRSPSA